MKKKLLSFLLVLALAMPLAPAARALGAFADVTDAETARNVEVLRLMGVIEGDNGSFRPYGSLTRAEFCKMTVVLAGKRDASASYGGKTVFPDVKATHWASGYINYAAGKDAGLVHGLPDGTFLPEREITYGEAVTVLMRMFGYTDADSSGIWPQGYLDLGASIGLTSGLSLPGGAPISRAQAAKLFVNALSAKDLKGSALLGKLGYQADLSKETTLRSIDLAKGELRTGNGSVKMANPMDSKLLYGVKGCVISNAAGEAVTFLPSAGKTGGVYADAAVIVGADGSTNGFEALTGGITGYTIYKNGVKTAASSLKRYDVATYNADANAILVTDTRAAVYYESCAPSPEQPNTVTVLNTVFDVVPTAQQSLSLFKPGDQMTVLFTADGRIAGAVERDTAGAQGNAFVYVSDTGKASLLCGTALIALNYTDTANLGTVCRISQTKYAGSPVIQLSPQSGGLRGALDLSGNKLGGIRLAENAMFLVDGELLTAAELSRQNIPAEEVRFARADSDGRIDLVVIGTKNEYVIGRVSYVDEKSTDPETGSTVYERRMKLSMPGSDLKPSKFVYNVADGDFAAAQINSDGNYINLVALTKHSGVPASAWIGDTAVNLGGSTYTVPSDVMCYNVNSGSWFEDLDAAKAYGGTMTLYTRDGVVYGINVRS